MAWSVGSDSTDLPAGSNELAGHNTWNLMLESFCHADVNILMEALDENTVLVMVTLSCRFALDVLCDKSETRKGVNVFTFDDLQNCSKVIGATNFM